MLGQQIHFHYAATSLAKLLSKIATVGIRLERFVGQILLPAHLAPDQRMDYTVKPNPDNADKQRQWKNAWQANTNVGLG
jgi:hypothetical protein